MYMWFESVIHFSAAVSYLRSSTVIPGTPPSFVDDMGAGMGLELPQIADVQSSPLAGPNLRMQIYPAIADEDVMAALQRLREGHDRPFPSWEPVRGVDVPGQDISYALFGFDRAAGEYHGEPPCYACDLHQEQAAALYLELEGIPEDYVKANPALVRCLFHLKDGGVPAAAVAAFHWAAGGAFMPPSDKDDGWPVPLFCALPGEPAALKWGGFGEQFLKDLQNYMLDLRGVPRKLAVDVDALKEQIKKLGASAQQACAFG